jgi:hypothetical protein
MCLFLPATLVPANELLEGVTHGIEFCVVQAVRSLSGEKAQPDQFLVVGLSSNAVDI